MRYNFNNSNILFLNVGIFFFLISTLVEKKCFREKLFKESKIDWKKETIIIHIMDIRI